jgi:hypothetical protein
MSVPVIKMVGKDLVTVEGSYTKEYKDAGAICTDKYDGVLPIKTIGHVTLHASGTYVVTYTCANKRSVSSLPLQRVVVVADRRCPVCHVLGPSKLKVEAGFGYEDKGAYFSDEADGPHLTKGVVVNNPLAGARGVKASPGIYLITYRFRDSAGNWNDGEREKSDEKCAGVRSCKDGSCNREGSCTREVQVEDTLKPVIALSYHKKVFHQSPATDTSPHNGKLNPATKRVASWPRYEGLMVETNAVYAYPTMAAAVTLTVVGFVALASVRVRGGRAHDEQPEV